jgi:tetratricopeptide (TPR) repeat protein
MLWYRHNRKRLVGAMALLASALLASQVADAGICFTSGKVYVQQKVYDKACQMLECARQQEPDNDQVYSLLAFARAQMRQYVAAGGAFTIGEQLAEQKKDDKRMKEVDQNRRAVTAQLFNAGIAALNRGGTISPSDTRTTAANSPQAKVEKEHGAPKDFARFSEGGKDQEFWYYPGDKIQIYFPPDRAEPVESPYTPFTGAPDPQQAVTDSTVFPPFSGGSNVSEAAYNFELACYVNPTESGVYKNLSYVFEVLGRPDDAIHAAQLGLKITPKDQQLIQNLRVAAMGRGNRLFNSQMYMDAIPAYWTAIEFDSAGTLLYLSQIAQCYQLGAEAQPSGSKERAAAYDSAAVTYMRVYEAAPPESTTIRENSIFNAAVVEVNLENYKKATEYLDIGLKSSPNSLDLLLLYGQAKYQLGAKEEAADAAAAKADYQASVTAMKHAVELDPRNTTAHQFLFLAYNKLGDKDLRASEFTVYKALTDGKQRTGSSLKTWVDSADNRLGPTNQCNATLKSDGMPDEVRTYADGDKAFETWFYWNKGVAITFLDGQVFARATFPAAKS